MRAGTKRICRIGCLVLGLCLLLTACGKNKHHEKFEAIAPRDAGMQIELTMRSEIEILSESIKYISAATWLDRNGVRHMFDSRSIIDRNGEMSIASNEAWSGPEKIYLNVGESGWQEREPGTGADRPTALDLDAAVSFISKLPDLTEKAAITPGMSSMGDAYQFDVKFNDVRKLAGGAADGLLFDSACTTCVFDPDSQALKFIQAAASDETGSFLIEVEIKSWNVPGELLEIPGNITDPKIETPVGLEVERQDGNQIIGYAMQADIPEDMTDSRLFATAVQIRDENRYDRVQLVRQDGFDELQYHTHGIANDAAWYGLLSVESYEDTNASKARYDELASFNDIWYGGQTGQAPEGWAGWSGSDDDGNTKLELLRRDGDRILLLQTASADDLDLDALLDSAEIIIANIEI